MLVVIANLLLVRTAVRARIGGFRSDDSEQASTSS